MSTSAERDKMSSSTGADPMSGSTDSGNKRKGRAFTVEEVAKHITRDNGLIIIEDKVYDIVKFLKNEIHPGGEVIWTHAGKDATDVFDSYHPDYVRRKKLIKYRVGYIENPEPPPPMVAAYRKMHKDIKDAGLYDVQPMYWVIKALYPLGMVLTAMWIYHQKFQSYVPNLFGGFLVGLAQHQWAFVGHDGCHTSCLGVTAGNYEMGNLIDFTLSIICATAGFGCSSIWWKYTHNQHHVVTNEFDRDPDVTHLPFYAVTSRMITSMSKGKKMGDFERWLARLLVGIQTFTFWPIMLIFARASLFGNFIAMQWFAGKVPTMPWQPLHFPPFWVWFDRIAVLAHFVWVYALFKYCPPEGYKFASFFASWVTVSFLHVQLVLSHWERPMKHSTEEEDNWFVKQILTGCNIEPYWWNEWFLGGLHFQVEHHVYPRLPRYHLRKVRDDYVIPFCKKWNIHYENQGFFQALNNVMISLGDVASHAQDKMKDD